MPKIKTYRFVWARPFLVSTVIAVWSVPLGWAETITLLPVTGEPTGASVNALAGPLFGSSIDSDMIGGSTSGTVSTSSVGNSVTHDYAVELDYSVDPAFFDSSFTTPMTRTSTLDHRASAESVFHFTVDVPTEYSVMGFFSVDDEDGATVAGNVELEVELLEFDSFDGSAPPPATVFYSYQASTETLDQGFVVGEMDGDTTNSLIGDFIGILDPSKVYRYRTLVTINAIDPDGAGPMEASDGFADATGAHTIVFTSAVPEPAGMTAAVIAMGAVAGAIRRRKRKIKPVNVESN